jgi:hypothetical protein
MCSRPRPLLLPLLVGLFAPLGCMNWECECPQMIVPTHLGGPSPSVAGDISFTQAAQLCLSAGDNLEKKGYVAEAIAQYENARKHDPQALGVASTCVRCASSRAMPNCSTISAISTIGTIA